MDIFLTAFDDVPDPRADNARCSDQCRRRRLVPGAEGQPSALMGRSRTPSTGSLTHSSEKPSPGWFSDPRRLRKDAARNRKDNGPANISILRGRAAGVARRDTSKGSLSIKPKLAG